ncbi:MAG: amino acid permease [Tannerella sp.]|jgi:amino acid transporter|nr:amino acid permease [Tannerella sp.]
MKSVNTSGPASGFGTTSVYLTALGMILGAVMFLRFGYATGMLGFWGAMLVILLGHCITIPTAFAISEIATNTRVEGGGEYFIISRSFGLKIGSTIGLALYLSQAVSVAFYIIAFAESFEWLFDLCRTRWGIHLPRQAISIPTLAILSYIILRKGAGSGMKMLYAVMAILVLSLVAFFCGKPLAAAEASPAFHNFGFFHSEHFFAIFAICFPAFTGMTAGVGLSGDLRDPGRSIPTGTIAGTFTGLAVYALILWKLAVSAPAEELVGDQLIMSRIAVWGAALIPAGLMASTFSSAMSSVLVAPRTLQALAGDRTFPSQRLNRFLACGRGETREPFNATVVSLLIAGVFIVLGNVDRVAEIISMFFLITYGSLCLISFLNHFGSPPSYRPRFKSRWYVSLGGFVLSVWVMFMIHPLNTLLAYLALVAVYLFLEHTHRDRKGVINIFEGALFQLNRRLQVFMQKRHSGTDCEEWRPAVVCISANSFEREKPLDLMAWISYRHGFGTYFHFIEGYYSRQTHLESKHILAELVNSRRGQKSNLYIDTMISPSYTSAIAQVIQSPSISGMENNMVLFEYDRSKPGELERILDNVRLVRAGDFDICIFCGSSSSVKFRNGIHIWIRPTDEKNTNLMILLGYIISAHPGWRGSQIKIFSVGLPGQGGETGKSLEQRIADGRLPITLANIEIVAPDGNETFGEAISRRSKYAGLTIVGFGDEIIGHDLATFFNDCRHAGDLLFVNASHLREFN